MPSIYIENFEAGLDTRKSRFTAPPGSLVVLRNAHITRGKEIERRKAFAHAHTLPAETYGLHTAQGNLYTFGSVVTPAGMPVSVTYQRLEAPDGAAMSALIAAENFNGKIYAIAEYADGDMYHFYNGARVTDWDAIAADVGSNDTVASALGAKLDTDGTADVIVVNNRIVLTATTAGQPFTLTVNANLTTSELQAAVPAEDEVRATANFTITGGSEGQTFNVVSHVRVNDIDLMASAIDWQTSNEATAQAVADAINAYVTAYSASVSLATVTISAVPGLGADANGYPLDVLTDGDVTVTADAAMAGGADPVPAVPQISEALVAGTFGATKLYEATLAGTTYRVTGAASGTATHVRAVAQKMYGVTQSLLYFSGFVDGSPDPTQWDSMTTGTGFINMSTQYAGGEDLVGVGVYQSRVAAFSRWAVQIWTVDADPAKNTSYQVLLNVGAIAARSIVEYGDLDIFFLSESGIRSLRARDSSNLASANDVGVAIDNGLTAFMRGLSRREVRQAVAVVEPTDSRYLLAIGSRVYVFSNFPGSKVAAWSTYEVDGAISDWAVAGSRLYARVGNSVRLYGGFSGEEYDTDETEVVLPFLDGSNPAGNKQFTDFDLGATGTWTVEAALEPNAPDEWETVAALLQSTYGSSPTSPAVGQSTHIALRLTTTAAARAVIGNLLIHYEDLA